MRVLIVGLGSIGRRHLANIRKVNRDALITVWHQHARNRGETENHLAIDHIAYSIEEALEFKPDVALIASPAASHVATGISLARQNVHLFIEKPISATQDGVSELLHICRERSLTLMVGYNLRFYRPLQIMRQALMDGQIGRAVSFRAEVGQYLPDWRPGTDYRQGVTARRDLGGGAVLELSHELDYARWFMGEVETLSAQIGKLSDLEIDVEDTAEIILKFRSGAIGNVHLDLIQRVPTRSCTIIGTEGTLIWTWDTHCVKLFSSATNAWTDLHPASMIDRNEMYVIELMHFLDCVKDGCLPLVSGDDGRRVLEIALAAKRSAQEQRVVRL